MRRFKIFGPPGTGKTTHLLSLLEQEFKHVHPTECAFVSFTRKGAYEGAQRAVKQFKLDLKELQYFRTIHSICFAQLGARRHDMLQPFHYKQFSDVMGLRFLGHYTEELHSGNDQYLFAEQLSRLNPAAYARLEPQLNLKKLVWVVANYRKFKRQLQLLDFTDLLERYIAEGTVLPVKVAFIDEAQDLTTLQWSVVNKMLCNCERVYVAGDDDQAIYEWAGADVATFLAYPGAVTTLTKSYRLPAVVHNKARAIATHILGRQEKDFESNGTTGEIEYKTSLQGIDFTEPTLILSRNKRYLDAAESELQSLGAVYSRGGERSISRKLFSAIMKYELWRKGVCSEQELALYNQYYKSHNKEEPWYNVLNVENSVVTYYRRLLARKVAPETEPVVELSTIHASKGGEREHVVLLMDISSRVARNFETYSDSEMRCYYVAVTRAKRKLTIVLSRSRYSFPLLNNEADKRTDKENDNDLL